MSALTTPKSSARESLIKMMGDFNTLEITWLMNSLADSAAEKIKNYRNDILRLREFGLDRRAYGNGVETDADVAREIETAKERIAFCEKTIRLAIAWREAKNEFELPHLVSAIIGRKSRPPKSRST